ncbi:dihydropyrimidinase [Klenkia terrae]|uniref:Dihydropyrimidinase n=2 Tax=Klenkia terrae TaxID=1052259 RepID=A0ABU8E9F8_9ACTN|nr:dihydropyrimidinase [Klenkia terrae]
MTPDLVVRGGTVVTDGWSGAADVVVAGGRVQALVEPGSVRGPDELDATGRVVVPGGVDPHCHVGFTSGDFTSLDDHRECTTAAVAGGTTTIVDFAIPRPGEAPADAAVRQRAKADQGLCDSALHASVVEWDGTTAEQLRQLCDEGLRTVKMFTTYRGESMADEDTFLRVMKTLGPLGGMVVAHCEANHLIEEQQAVQAAAGRISAAHHHETRTELAEDASVAEVLAIAEALGTPVYFVHQSTAAAVDQVATARRRGVRAYTEAVAHHLTLDDSAYRGEHPERFVCCPPLRSAATVAELGTRLVSGTIATVGSDHCCYDTAQKTSVDHDVRVMPNGLPGVETRLVVVQDAFVATGRMPWTRFVEVTAAAPARLNGLYPRKGSLLPGSDADIAVWDPAAQRTVTAAGLHQATDYTPYEGRTVTGWPTTVVVGGHVVVDGGRVVDDTARGRHLPAAPLTV